MAFPTPQNNIDRKKANKAASKAVAYACVDKPKEARTWLKTLCKELDLEDMLK